MNRSDPPPLVFVTGTGTDVGKTIVTAAIAALATAAGRRVSVIKPVQTGVRPDQPGDLADVQRLAGIKSVAEFVRYPDPLAPEAAARRLGESGPRVSDLVTRIRNTSAGTAPAGAAPAGVKPDLVLVEGAGGLLVRLNEDGETMADLAAALAAPVLVVSRPDLGTLNHTSLTLEALAARELRCMGVVIGSWPADPDLACLENMRDLAALAVGSGGLLGRIPAGAGALDRTAFLKAARAGLAPELGGLFGS